MGEKDFQWNLPYESSPAKTHMTDSAEIASPPQPTRSRNSNFSVQIQIKPTSQFEFVPRDTEESESLGLVNFGGDVFSVESVI